MTRSGEEVDAGSQLQPRGNGPRSLKAHTRSRKPFQGLGMHPNLSLRLVHAAVACIRRETAFLPCVRCKEIAELQFLNIHN